MDCCKCYGVEDVVRAVGSLIQYIWALAADWLHDEECGWESNHQVTLVAVQCVVVDLAVVEVVVEFAAAAAEVVVDGVVAVVANQYCL